MTRAELHRFVDELLEESDEGCAAYYRRGEAINVAELRAESEPGA